MRRSVRFGPHGSGCDRASRLGAVVRAAASCTLTAVVAYCGLRALEPQRLHVVDVDPELRVVRVVDRPDASLKTPSSSAGADARCALGDSVRSGESDQLAIASSQRAAGVRH